MVLTCMCSCVFTAPNNQTTLWSCGNQGDLGWTGYTMAGLRTSGSPMDPVISSCLFHALFSTSFAKSLRMGLVFLVLCQICLLLTSIWKSCSSKLLKYIHSCHWPTIDAGATCALQQIKMLTLRAMKRYAKKKWMNVIIFIHRKIGVVYW